MGLWIEQNKKQEAFDEQLKFSKSTPVRDKRYAHDGDQLLTVTAFARSENQFRALDEEEISFLDSLVDDDNSEELKKQQEIKDQLAAFKA